jgi:hypothetical protein
MLSRMSSSSSSRKAAGLKEGGGRVVVDLPFDFGFDFANLALSGVDLKSVIPFQFGSKGLFDVSLAVAFPFGVFASG